MMWKRFHFEGNRFFDSVEGPDDWQLLREAYPDLTDDELLASKEATYSGSRSLAEREFRPNFGRRSEHDGEKTLRDFFVQNNMLNLIPVKAIAMLLVLLFSAECFAQDRYRSVDRYRSRQYDLDPPKLYAGDGKYLGELSSDRYSLDSISNPYGLYGSRYSIDSVNNPYGLYGRYSTHPIYIFPRNRWQGFIRN